VNILTHWERLLFSTGGAINIQKSHWYIMTWNWKGGTASLTITLSTPVQLLLTAGYSTEPSPVPHL
jgi:hypothetical protein